MSQKKQIFKFNILRKFLNDANSCVSLVPSTRLLALPPFFLNDMKSGIFYLLNSILKKYDRSLDGIIIGYQNVKILMDENTGIIPIGSAETEVNVSVEFYIFQPKIGNTLEGVVNKKSNNHIGCLVHRYFNATILKPEDVEYEDWNCKNFDVNDKILFRVKDLDFTGLLPYIEGIVKDEDLLDFTRSKKMDGCDSHVHNIKSLAQQDEFFYSTQLEPNLESKMNTSCSPIPKTTFNNEKPETPIKLSKVKKKDRKRKAEDSVESGAAAKKSKKEQSQINGTVDFVDEILREELNKVKEKLNKSEKKKREKEAKESDSLYEKLMKGVKNEITPKKIKDSDSDSTSKKKKKKKKHKEKEKCKNGSMYGVEITPEKPHLSKTLYSDSEETDQSDVRKKNVNGVASSSKSSIQTLLDQLVQEKEKVVLGVSDSVRLKESTKQKKERKPEETEESLYEKLLREARSSIEVREDSPPKKKRKTK